MDPVPATTPLPLPLPACPKFTPADCFCWLLINASLRIHTQKMRQNNEKCLKIAMLVAVYTLYPPSLPSFSLPLQLEERSSSCCCSCSHLRRNDAPLMRITHMPRSAPPPLYPFLFPPPPCSFVILSNRQARRNDRAKYAQLWARTIKAIAIAIATSRS